MPAVNSRFHDPSCIDDPQLPVPAPQLYSYCLPPLPEHDPKRFRQSLIARQQQSNIQQQTEVPTDPSTLQQRARDSEAELQRPPLTPTTEPSFEPIPAIPPETSVPSRETNPGMTPPNGQRSDVPQEHSLRYGPDDLPPLPSTEAPKLSGGPAKQSNALIPTLATSLSNKDFNNGAGRPRLERLPPAAELRNPIQQVTYKELIAQLLPTTNAEDPEAISEIVDELPVEPESTLSEFPKRGSDSDTDLQDQTDENSKGGLRVVPIPDNTWESLPDSCLNRMLEFESIRDEFQRTYAQAPSAAERDKSPRLALEDIVTQALINSREFQDRKEALYESALCLCLERFAYDIQFAPFGTNGTDLNFSHDRNTTTSTQLGIPTEFNIQRMLTSGGDFVLQFANDILIEFDGSPNVTTAGSRLIAGLSQNLLQNDRNFESLTIAERRVVYDARTFARFRKTLFRDLANQYYNLLLTYRGIEIDSQDYFSNLRGLLQAQAEYRAGRLPRFQVDQFEQNALASRSNLISSCNNLESSFDSLKFGTGLPPELPINLDLRELEELTLRDEATVAGELVRRALRNLTLEREQSTRDDNVLLNGAIDLAGRTLTLLDLRQSLGQKAEASNELRMLWAELQVNETSMLVDLNRTVLKKDQNARPPAPPLRLFQRAMEVVDSQLTVIERQLAWYAISKDVTKGGDNPDDSTSANDDLEPTTNAVDEASENIFQSLANLTDEYDAIASELVEAVEKRNLERIPTLVQDATNLLNDADELGQKAAELTENLSNDENATGMSTGTTVLGRIDKAIEVCQQIALSDDAGLAPIELDMDDAMLTAVVQRFELMNERGALADQWRQIKLAGDDLRSVLNLNAGFRLNSDPNTNNPFDFSLDQSRTTLGLSFDAPLNRRAQAKDYRLALLNYNAALRNLMELEDSIKVAVRDDLRDLQLDREQYDIAVASAALAKERVVSTRLQLRLGIENVAARDVLESQQAYTASLSSVARQHIRYILDRIDLFLDLELLEVDDTGFWSELYNDDFAPLPNWQYPVNAGCAYGRLPACVWYSDCMRRMDCIPFGSPQLGQCPTYSTPTQDDAKQDNAPQSNAAVWGPDQSDALANESTDDSP